MPDVLDSAQEHLEQSVRTHWPDLAVRLDARVGEFVRAAQVAAAGHLLEPGTTTARFVNLCCAFGPGFERKPENEWALAILANERIGDWVKLHQLVAHASTELKRRSDGRVTSDQLLRSDGDLMDKVDAASRAGNSDAIPLARLACDLEAVDIRLLETDWRREYRPFDGTWQLAPLGDMTNSLRIGSGQPAPPLLSVLTQAAPLGPAARLQIRLLMHAVCDQDRHPVVLFAGEHGLSTWTGHNARAVSWLVYANPRPSATNGLEVMLLEEPPARTSLLQAASCGLRDQGVPFGSLHTYVWAYSADQWLFAWQREPMQQQQWPLQAAAAPGQSAPPTRCRIECNGAPMPSTRWAQAFRDVFDVQLSRGFDALFAVWKETVSEATMTLDAGLVTGRGALTWGWRETAQGMSERPFLRLAGEFDLSNTIELVLSGELVLGATRTRVRLLVQGHAPMKQPIARGSLVPGLPDILLPSVCRWRFSYRIEFDPIAVAEGALWSEAGPCTGALVGEVGLRPRSMGGGGWQWYVRLESEPVSVPLCIHDPVLGRTRSTLALLPAVKLLDGSLG
ncbi:MAG: hypothetical protein ABI343_22345 [Burkholderiaceae bacterium]